MNSGTSTKQHEHGPAAQSLPSAVISTGAQRTGETPVFAPAGSLGSSPALSPSLWSRPESSRSEDAVEGPASSPRLTPTSHQHRSATPLQNTVILTPSEAKGKDPRTSPEAPLLPPGSSSVTDTAAPDNEHRDAPRNVREVFVKRAQILRSIRRFFDERGYLEVETPMMHTVAGGAAARPFKTHHNALDIPLSLRIAPELYLKRLVVGGLDRVYEINRNFRNEGVSTQHNPEFTMLEFYQAYANYHDLMDLTEELVTQVATEVNGTSITNFNGNEIDLSKWQKLSMREAINTWWPAAVRRNEVISFDTFPQWVQAVEGLWRYYTSPEIGPTTLPEFSTEEGRLEAKKKAHIASGIFRQLEPLFLTYLQNPHADWSASLQAWGRSVAEVFELLAEEHLIQPTIIYDFPLAVSPLSKQKPEEPDWVERFEFYIGGFEVGNAFSELNDPEEQKKRFEQQLAEHKGGDKEAMAEMDEDYVRALRYGLPPAAGEGIGIDRLTMLLTGSRSIRDVILFPLMRPLSPTPPPDPTPE